MDYFGARYYGALSGRFVSTDSQAVTKENFLNPQRWNLYTYVNNDPLAAIDPDGADGKGKDGNKTISVFLDISKAERDPLLQRDSDTGEMKIVGRHDPDWEKLQDLGAKNGFTLNMYGSTETAGRNALPMTGGAFNDALQNDDVVLYVGHGRGDTSTSPFVQEGMQVGGYTYTKEGTKINGTSMTVAKPQVSAEFVGNFSCDGSRNGGNYFNFIGKNQKMATNHSNWDGVTATSKLEKATYAFVKTYFKTGNDKKAQAAYDKVLRNSAKKQNQNAGDQMVVKTIN